MTETKISVVVTTYNRSGYLGLTLKSFINQTLSKDKYEIVVIDDGSSDDTKDVVDSFSKFFPIKYVY